MKKITLVLGILLIALSSFSQKKKISPISGSIMVINNFDGKFGIGGVSDSFLKVDLNKKVSLGTAFIVVVLTDIKSDYHNYAAAGFSLKLDYKKYSLGYNLITIAGKQTKFIGLGVKL